MHGNLRIFRWNVHDLISCRICSFVSGFNGVQFIDGLVHSAARQRSRKKAIPWLASTLLPLQGG